MMNKRWKTTLAAVVIPAVIIALAALIVWLQSRSALTYNASLYFLNSSKASLTLENRNLLYREPEEIPEKIIDALISGPENSESSRIMNKRTRLLSINDDDEGNYKVDFSDEFLSEDDERNTMAVYAVVKSLSAMSTVRSVEVTIDGAEYKTAEGNVIGALTADDINLSSDTDTSETRSVILYFADTATNKLSSEVRSVRITDQRPTEQYVIEELIKGPVYEGHSPVLSKDTNLISVTVSDNVGFVNFDKSFIEKNTSAPEKGQLALFAVINSMTELEGVNRVQFLVDGKRVEKFGEIDISNPIGRNAELIE